MQFGKKGGKRVVEEERIEGVKDRKKEREVEGGGMKGRLPQAQRSKGCR